MLAIICCNIWRWTQFVTTIFFVGSGCRNCEDIAMSFLVANATSAPPLWVKGSTLHNHAYIWIWILTYTHICAVFSLYLGCLVNPFCFVVWVLCNTLWVDSVMFGDANCALSWVLCRSPIWNWVNRNQQSSRPLWASHAMCQPLCICIWVYAPCSQPCKSSRCTKSMVVVIISLLYAISPPVLCFYLSLVSARF